MVGLLEACPASAAGPADSSTAPPRRATFLIASPRHGRRTPGRSRHPSQGSRGPLERPGLGASGRGGRVRVRPRRGSGRAHPRPGVPGVLPPLLLPSGGGAPARGRCPAPAPGPAGPLLPRAAPFVPGVQRVRDGLPGPPGRPARHQGADPDQCHGRAAARAPAGRPGADQRPPQPDRDQSAARPAPGRVGAALPGHDRGLRPGPARPRAPAGRPSSASR